MCNYLCANCFWMLKFLILKMRQLDTIPFLLKLLNILREIGHCVSNGCTMYVFESFVFFVLCVNFHMETMWYQKEHPTHLWLQRYAFTSQIKDVSVVECTCWTTTLSIVSWWCSPSITYVGLLKSDIEFCNSWSARSCVRKFFFSI
jgi:hypothetical protein